MLGGVKNSFGSGKGKRALLAILVNAPTGRKFLAGPKGLTLVSHNAVGSKEFERGHFKQCWVEQKFSGCWSASRLRMQALLNELLEKGKEEVE